jgi:hypothetical protein
VRIPFRPPFSARLVAALLLAASVGWPGSPANARSHGSVLVYWDQNEEEDVFINGQVKQLVPPYDPNGQMCIFPGHSGRFVTGYNPTLPSQMNPGSLKPLMNPPVGEAVWDRHGNFTGKTIFVPGPFALPGSTVGGDIPPDTSGGGSVESGAYNNNGTFTGCAFDRHGNLFAVDLGTAQGQFPSPDNGRIIEWFAPHFTSYCIIDGPTAGGVGPHHVDGTGGLKNPGTLALYHGDLYVPETGALRVLRFPRHSLPHRARECPNGVLEPPAQPEVFIKDPNLLFPSGIAHDPTSRGWAVTNVASNIIQQQAIAWYDATGKPDATRRPVPTGNYSPFGVAIAPKGDLYFVDIHVVCQGGVLANCGPGSHQGGVFKVTFANGVPSTPQAIATGFDFPVSVTVCDPSRQVCPTPP